MLLLKVGIEVDSGRVGDLIVLTLLAHLPPNFHSRIIVPPRFVALVPQVQVL